MLFFRCLLVAPPPLMWMEKPSSQTRLLKVCLCHRFDLRSVYVLFGAAVWKAFYWQRGFNAALQWWRVSHWSESFPFFSPTCNCDIQAFKNISMEQLLGTKQLLGGCEGGMEFCKNSIPKKEQRVVKRKKKVCMHCNSVTVCLFNALTWIEAIKQKRFCTSVRVSGLLQGTALAEALRYICVEAVRHKRVVFSSHLAVNGNRSVSSSIINDKYQVGKVIGDGNFAVVKECVERCAASHSLHRRPGKHWCSSQHISCCCLLYLHENAAVTRSSDELHRRTWCFFFLTDQRDKNTLWRL